MKIVSGSAFEHRNLIAPVPAVRLVLDFDNLSDHSPAQLGPEFGEILRLFLSELAKSGGAGEEDAETFTLALGQDESLRLGHIVVRIALALQRVAGAEVSYATVDLNPSSDIGGTPGRQQITYAHLGADFGIAAGRAAFAALVQLLNLARAGGETQERAEGVLNNYARELISHSRAQGLDISTAALVREAIRRDIPWRRVSPEARYVQLGYGCWQKTIHETLSHRTPSVSIWMGLDKAVSSRLLTEIGLPVPRQGVVKVAENIAEAAETAVATANSIGYPVVVKPKSGMKGLGISVDVTDAAGVRRAVEQAAKYEHAIIIESFVAGDDHRLLVVGGKMIAAAKRIRAHVVGDGRRSVADLVAEVNRDPRRGTGFENILVRLELDDQANQILAGQGLSADQIPPSGQTVYLRNTANISTGGTALDVTDAVHPDNARAAVRAAAALALDVAGVDILSTDISRSYRENGAAICEINSSPGLRPHWLGDASRDVVGPILDAIYPPGAPSRVPIAAITGTNGKTTTTRMVARILEQDGHTVGFATTDGAYIKRERVVEGDVAGTNGARIVLQNPEIDIAVLEAARRGIIAYGLGFDWCDVAAVLNIEDDHIGTDGIRDIEDLARIKGLVARSARKLLVLNADDEHCVAMAEQAEAERICYVTLTPDHGTVAKPHIASGGMAVTMRSEADGALIELHDGGQVTPVLPAFDVASAMAGKAIHNVHNAMFAAAVAHGLGASIAHIRDGLMGLTGSHTDTPGRLDFFTGFAFQVILDYAHNAQEFRAVSAVIRQLECPGRRIIALTSPGNRTDPHIDNLATIAAQYSYDHYICYRRDDLRGRGPSEVPERLRDGLLAAGIAAQNISVVPVEEDTVNAALDMAEAGDIVALLYTDHDKVWDMMKARLAGE